MDIYDVRNLSNLEVENAIDKILGLMPWVYEYDEKRWASNLNAIHAEISKHDSTFSFAFVDNLYKLIGHHDFMEANAILADAPLRSKALLLTLMEKHS